MPASTSWIPSTPPGAPASAAWSVPPSIPPCRKIRGGSAVGPLLAASGAFSSDLTQALIVGEETGSLDDELRRMSIEFREKALSSLETFAEWLPRLIYLSVVMYLGWKILEMGQAYYAQLRGLME